MNVIMNNIFKCMMNIEKLSLAVIRNLIKLYIILCKIVDLRPSILVKTLHFI